MQTKSPLVASEDWWSVYVGVFLIAVVAIFGAVGLPLDFVKRAMPAPWPTRSLIGGLAAAWPSYVAVLVILAAITGIGATVMGGRLTHYLASFAILFAGAFLILVVGSQQTLKRYGLETPFWALVVGLIVGNLIRLPAWFRSAAGRTEFFIKTGIVLLGASLPFTIILQGGVWGLLEAVIIVAVGFTVAFVVARALGFDNRFAAVLGAGGSVCGVSAAIAVGASVEAEEKQVGYVVSLVVIYALVLIFVIPILGRVLHLAEVVTGAWIGGSELADAAGLAAAAIVGEKAVHAFSLVKLNRDVMIGILAFIFATVAVTRWEAGKSAQRPSGAIIWQRFPKFVLAFLVASAFVSILVARVGKPQIDAHLIGTLNTFRAWLFTLAFLCIGLNTRFSEIRLLGLRPIIAFTVVVIVNLVLGFILSNLFFGGIVAKPLG